MRVVHSGPGAPDGAGATGAAGAIELDEEFLLRVDRAVLASKQCDPCRLTQVHRALQEEVHRNRVADSMEMDRPRGRDWR